MKFKTMSLVTIGLLLTLICHTTVSAKSSKEEKVSERVKAEIIKLGTGPEARIKVKLRDKSKIKGYVSKIGQNDFVVVEDKSNSQLHINYGKVKQVKGKNNLTGKEIGYIAITIAILAVVGLIAF